MNFEQSEKELKEFEEALQINEYDLDIELSMQPELYFHAAKKFAWIMSVYETKKQDLEVIYAHLDSNIRKSFDDLTESRIKQKIIATSDYINQGKEVLEWKKHAALWKAVEEAFSKRGSMLKLLARSKEIQQGSTGYARTQEYEKNIHKMNEKRRLLNLLKNNEVQ